MHTSVDSAVDNAVRSATGFSNGLPEALSFGLSPDFGQRIGSLDPARRNLVPQLLLVLMIRLSPATHHRSTGNEQRTTQWLTTLWLGGRRQLLATG
jgi:hypothetical protein